MNMDWISGLAAQDQSLESLMAKQNLQKQLGPLIDVAQLAQQKQRAEEDRAEKEREFGVRQAEVSETHRKAEADRQQAEEDRKVAAKQSRYNVIHDNLKPGDKMKKGPDFDLMSEFGTGNQFEADPSDPEAFIYQKHAFEQAQLKNKQDQEKAQHQQKIEDEHLVLAKAEAKRQDEAAKRQQQAADRAQQTFDEKHKAQSEAVQKLDPLTRGLVLKEDAAWLKANSAGLLEGSDEYAARHQAARDAMIKKATDEAVKSGRMKANVELPKPGGGASGSDPNTAPGQRIEVAPGVWVTKHQ